MFDANQCSPHALVATRLFSGRQRQRGAALVVGLIFLLITTLMALTAMSGVIMQERMAGNLRNTSIATAGAESALRAGELWLRDRISAGEEFVGDCSGSSGMVDRSAEGCGGFDTFDDFRNNQNWLETPGQGIHLYPENFLSDGDIGNPNASAMARRPQYLIEHMGELLPDSGGADPDVEWDTGGGYGGSADAGTGTAARVYRISGRSTGSSANVVRSAESFYASYVGGGSPPPDDDDDDEEP